MNSKRKNIKLPENEKGHLASMFLEKLYHYQGTFIASLIFRFLENNNLASEEALDALTDEDAKQLAGIIPVDFNLPGGNLDLQPNITPSAAQMQSVNDLARLLTATLTTIKANDSLSSVSSMGNHTYTNQPDDADLSLQAAPPEDISIDDDDFQDDTDLEDFDFSLLDQFRQ